MASTPVQDSPVVLVAKDEVLVRMMTVDVLEEAGCAVIETANAEAALAVLDQRSDVQVLVTDVEMPPGPLNGIDLARLTRDQFPHIGVVIVSSKVRPRPWRPSARCSFRAEALLSHETHPCGAGSHGRRGLRQAALGHRLAAERT